MLRGLPVQIEVEASDEELIPDAGEGARAEAGPAEEAVVAEGQLEAPGEEPMEAEDLHVPLGDREYQDHVLAISQPSDTLVQVPGVGPMQRRQLANLQALLNGADEVATGANPDLPDLSGLSSAQLEQLEAQLSRGLGVQAAMAGTSAATASEGPASVADVHPASKCKGLVWAQVQEELERAPVNLVTLVVLPTKLDVSSDLTDLHSNMVTTREARALQAFRELIDGWLHWKSAEYKAPIRSLPDAATRRKRKKESAKKKEIADLPRHVSPRPMLRVLAAAALGLAGAQLVPEQPVDIEEFQKLLHEEGVGLVGALKLRAQIDLGVGMGRLVDLSGNNLDGSSAIKTAFAAILGDGSVVSWDFVGAGGDRSAVRSQLKNVQQMQANKCAFAAILGNGCIVTWGHAAYGGDSRAAQAQLRNVQHIQASERTFAAILEDGSVVTWGVPGSGGDSSSVQDQLKNVQQIQANGGAFAAILEDGSVVTWGAIQANHGAFAAILDDGSVVTWGDDQSCGESSSVWDQLKSVQQIQAAPRAFAAILSDGSVVTPGVMFTTATNSAFAAILGDGSVVTWGDVRRGGDSRTVQHQLKNVQQIQACGFAFAAILGDGFVVTWGGGVLFGGNFLAVQDQLKNVQQIQATTSAFAAILGDGSVVTWVVRATGVTVELCSISRRMCSRSKPMAVLVLLFLAMDPS
eukprot:s5612_g1.t1